jgi:hypothetical protein
MLPSKHLILLFVIIMSLTKDSASKILQAKLHKDLATVRGERKFPSRPLEFISPLKVVAKGSDVAVGTGYLERIITGWGVFSVLAILGVCFHIYFYYNRTSIFPQFCIFRKCDQTSYPNSASALSSEGFNFISMGCLYYLGALYDLCRGL